MDQMLVLILWILFAIGAAYLVFWGAGKLAWDRTPQVIVAGIVFVLLLAFALNRVGMLNL